MIPWYSTFALCTEIILSIILLYIFYQAYHHKKFNKTLAATALTYEILFNISYMIYRVLTHVEDPKDTAFEIALAIFHGTLSLIMFVALVVFLVLAWKNYNKGINYFKKHRTLTVFFIIFWLLAVISGIIFYAVEYL